MEELIFKQSEKSERTFKPSLGFLGVGWIGRNRMEAVQKTEKATISMVADVSEETTKEALKAAPQAKQASSFDAILKNEEVDGVVIATPSALHANQSIQALNAGKSVFCQKPLGRTAQETAEVVRTAEKYNLSLGVDLSYRHTKAMRAVYNLIKSGNLGEIYAVELVFHNAYGPDKPWFYDPEQSGGGCVIDLGVHLTDLAMWCLDFPEVKNVSSKLFHQGKPLPKDAKVVEDYGIARIDLANDAAIDLRCSWNLQAGKEAEIKAVFYGTKGGACFRNINGSFYDFVAEAYYGTKTEVMVEPPDDWMGRAAAVWAEELAAGAEFDKDAWQYVKVSEILDMIYGR
ncbi:Gfo/Idh/MocA family oxidoreductase [Cytophagaceae bacterium ABcell3]|nr:Gfo/Idh/MocA family oxidoreductase [Cytophagaceae bacterium ABcell3]